MPGEYVFLTKAARIQAESHVDRTIGGEPLEKILTDHPMRRYRRTQPERIMRRYELADYAGKTDLKITTLEANHVRIPTRMGTGSPAIPLVKEGDQVQEGQLIGEIPEGKLGARIHASIAGKVTYTKHYPGKFLDARNPECSTKNEAQTWAFAGDRATARTRWISANLDSWRFGEAAPKTAISDLPGPSAQAFTLVKVNEGDVVNSVALTDGQTKDVLLATAQGMGIHFSEDEVRPMGLVAAGVNGIKLDEQDGVIGMEVLPVEGEVFLLTSDGKAKRLPEKEFPRQGRYGKGVRIWSLPARVTLAAIASGKPNATPTIHLTKGAPKTTRLDAAGIRKRASTKGDTVVKVKPGEEVVALTVGWSPDRFVSPAAPQPKSAPRQPAAAPSNASAKRKPVAKKTSTKSRTARRKK